MSKLSVVNLDKQMMAEDFEQVRRAIMGRKFTESDSYRLRDLIRLATVPDATKGTPEEIREAHEEQVTQRLVLSMLGIHFSPQQRDRIVSRVNANTRLAKADPQPACKSDSVQDVPLPKAWKEL